jgi:hypothetical protein
LHLDHVHYATAHLPIASVKHHHILSCSWSIVLHCPPFYSEPKPPPPLGTSFPLISSNSSSPKSRGEKPAPFSSSPTERTGPKLVGRGRGYGRPLSNLPWLTSSPTHLRLSEAAETKPSPLLIARGELQAAPAVLHVGVQSTLSSPPLLTSLSLSACPSLWMPQLRPLLARYSLGDRHTCHRYHCQHGARARPHRRPGDCMRMSFKCGEPAAAASPSVDATPSSSSPGELPDFSPSRLRRGTVVSPGPRRWF